MSLEMDIDTPFIFILLSCLTKSRTYPCANKYQQLAIIYQYD